MRIPASKQMHTIVLTYANGITRTVKVKAKDRETAEARALKRNPNATGVKPNG
jgi:hypothetical protein